MQLTPKYPIRFIEEPHGYEDPETGRLVAGVTSIIAAHGYGYSGPTGFAHRGKFLHTVNAILAAGDDVEDESVPIDWRGYVDALRSFYMDCRPTFSLVETALYDPVWQVAGTPDLFGELPTLGMQFAELELKTGDFTGCDFQLGGYARLIEVNTGLPVHTALRLQVSTDGMYRLVRYDLDLCKMDFAALMRLERRRRRNGTSV